MGAMVTLVVHGTFADDASWWKLGEGGEETFADRLEARLASRGMEDTVWRPVLTAGMEYEDFAWSGENRDRDRRQGAAKLARSLGRLADELGATADDQLQVNLVAHSHGGNVALDLLRRLPDTVRARRLAMLGTPLIWRRTSARILAIAAALSLFVFLFASLFAGILEATVEEQRVDPLFGFDLVVVFGISVFLGVVVLGLLLGPYLLLIAHPFAWVERALSWTFSSLHGGRAGRPAYGPRPNPELRTSVDQPPKIFMSREDEADLALHIGASPREVYRALVQRRLRGLMRWLEPLWLRGPFFVLAAPLLELGMEHYVLGFRWRSVLFNDYQLVSVGHVRASYDDAIERVDISDELVPALTEKLAGWRPTSPLLPPDDDLTETKRHIEVLRTTLLGVAADLRHQMQLRHTVYYETESVVGRVAEHLAG